MSDDPMEGTEFREDLPDVSQGRIDNIYKVIGSLNVSLDPDPLSYGPKRLNAKIAETRAHKSRIGRVFNQVSHDLGIYRRELRKIEAALKIAHDHLLHTDPEVRAGSNVADREAAVTVKLRKYVQRRMKLEGAIRDLEEVMTVIKAKRSDIGDTQGRLRDQMKMCQEELGLGLRWGSKAPGSSSVELEKGQGVVTAADISDIDDLIDQVEGEIHVAREKGEWKDPEFDPEAQDEDAEDDSEDEDSEESEEGAEDEDSEDIVGETEIAAETEPEPETEEKSDRSLVELPEKGEVVAQNPEIPGLTDTATEDDVDSFLDSFDAPQEVGKTEKKKVVEPTEDPIDFDALLNS